MGTLFHVERLLGCSSGTVRLGALPYLGGVALSGLFGFGEMRVCRGCLKGVLFHVERLLGM